MDKKILLNALVSIFIKLLLISQLIIILNYMVDHGDELCECV